MEIAKKLVKKYTFNGHELVKLIDKENGGHGSTINIGIQKAKGKYVKIIDGDDKSYEDMLELKKEIALALGVTTNEFEIETLENDYDDFLQNSVG